MYGINSVVKSSVDAECALCPAGRSFLIVAGTTGTGVVTPERHECLLPCRSFCNAGDAACERSCAVWCEESGGATVEAHRPLRKASESEWHFALTCHACEPGKFQASMGQPSCSSCAAGTYQSQYGGTECVSCAAGTMHDTLMPEFQKSSLACRECPAGTHQEHQGSTACIACVPGKYRNRNAASSPASTACSVCAADTFQGLPGQLSCAVKRKCPPGQGESVHGGIFVDRECAACIANSTHRKGCGTEGTASRDGALGEG